MTIQDSNTVSTYASTMSSLRVEHNYRDHAEELEGEIVEIPASPKRGKAPEQAFPVKLHYMLSEVEVDGLDSIVSWQVHGRCFVVHDQEKFANEVLSKWFQMNHYSSFQRQLNMYGFKRLTRGADKGAYYHECFLRGKQFLARRIQRVKIKGTGARKPASPDTEPNFYLYPMLPGDESKAANECRVAGRVATVSPDVSQSRETLSGCVMYPKALYPKALPKLPMSLSTHDSFQENIGNHTDMAVLPPPILPRFKSSRDYPKSFAALIAADIILRRQQDRIDN